MWIWFEIMQGNDNDIKKKKNRNMKKYELVFFSVLLIPFRSPLMDPSTKSRTIKTG